MPKRNVAVTNSGKCQVVRIPPTGNRICAGNLGAGRTAAEVAPTGGNATTAEICKYISEIPQIPLHLVGEIASCCAQSLVPACRIRHVGSSR